MSISFVSFIPLEIQDSKVRVVAKIGSINDDLDGNIIHNLSQELCFQSLWLRHLLYKINQNNILSAKVVVCFIMESSIFEEGRHKMIDEGINAYLRGNLFVSMSVLIPQIEQAVRNIIEISVYAVLKSNRGGGFHLRTFDELLREEVIRQVLGEDTQLYLRTLFIDQRGWNLRNDICHGITDYNSFSYQAADRVIHVLLILGIIRKKDS